VTRLSTGAFAVLVAATIAAFFVTQHLKVTTPLLAGSPRPVPAVIDPLRGVPCMQGRNSGSTTISFYLLHRADTVVVSVVSGLSTDGVIVRTVSNGRHMRKRVRTPDGVFHWDGREDDGKVAPDGTYHFRVALIHQNRTIDLTGVPVKVKTSPPHPVVTSATPSLIPGTSGTHVTIQYAGNESRGGTVRIYRTDLPGGPRLVKSFLTPWNGHTAIWDGKINGRPAPAGTYLVGLDVSDAACDTGHFPPRIPPAPGSTAHDGVTISYLAAQPPLDPVPAGSDAVVQVRSPGLAYHWALSRAGTRTSIATGDSSEATLSVHMPAGRPGLYKLALRSPAGTTTVPIVASGAPQAAVLVVLPALTWQGLNPVDDTGDGFPNTLANGGPIELDRPLVGGLPGGFTDEAGLLAHLDATHHSYELTTDLGLISGVGPRLRGHAAVVLAGSERWLPTPERAALRSFVTSGGSVLSLGVDSLRRAVTVAGNRALDPTAPSRVDALGAKIGALAAKAAPVPVTVTSDGLGLFTGVAAPLAGFPSYQPVLSVAPPGRVESSAAPSGGSPAIVGYGLGGGIVVDLSVPGFGAALSSDASARQLIDQIWTVISK